MGAQARAGGAPAAPPESAAEKLQRAQEKTRDLKERADKLWPKTELADKLKKATAKQAPHATAKARPKWQSRKKDEDVMDIHLSTHGWRHFQQIATNNHKCKRWNDRPSEHLTDLLSARDVFAADLLTLDDLLAWRAGSFAHWLMGVQYYDTS